MTTYDNWLTRGAEGPELDVDAFIESVDKVGEGVEMYPFLEAIYNAGPALNFSLRELDFPEHLRPYIVAIAKLSADIRAKVDDEYKARTTTYDDPRDGDE